MARRFFVNFRDRFSIPAVDRPDSGLFYTPQRWSSVKVGGPDTAEITVSGPLDILHEALRMLGDRVRIYNEEGSIVWHGYVHEAEINYGATVVRVSLEAMANRIAVVYTDARADGSSERKTTAWAEDAESIAYFGIKELRPSFEGSDEEAEAFRDAELRDRAWPVPQVRSTGGAVSVQGSGILFCRGSWHRLSWQYWQNLAGQEEYTDDGPGEVTIGASYTATTISFTSNDDILDSAGGLGSLQDGDSITITGSASNDGEYTVSTEGAAAIETSEKTIVNEAAGASITISRNGPRIDRIAQTFFLTHNTAAWQVAAISIRALRSEGATGALILELYDDDGGLPGILMASATVDGATLALDMAWVEFEFTAMPYLTYGYPYWIVVRKATPSLASYYQIDINEDAGYANGTCYTHNGSSWSLHSPAADMPFRIVGKQETTSQVRDILQANAEFGASSVVIVDASGIMTQQYREGDTLASDEVEDLIAQGTTGGGSLVVNLTENRHTIIEAQPSSSTAFGLRLRRDGQVELGPGARIAPGETIAGLWIQPDFLPILPIFKAATALFVESSEYDPRSDKLNFETDGALSVYRGRRLLRG